MKLLCSILALLVLTLSVQPVCAPAGVTESCCCSDDNCSDDACGDEHGTKDEHNKGCTNGCNPFQVCGCCAFSVVVPAQLAVVIFAPTCAPRVQWGVLSVGITEEPSSGFWQPPRVA